MSVPQALTIGRMMPLGTNSPPAEVPDARDVPFGVKQ